MIDVSAQIEIKLNTACIVCKSSKRQNYLVINVY